MTTQPSTPATVVGSLARCVRTCTSHPLDGRLDSRGSCRHAVEHLLIGTEQRLHGSLPCPRQRVVACGGTRGRECRVAQLGGDGVGPHLWIVPMTDAACEARAHVLARAP